MTEQLTSRCPEMHQDGSTENPCHHFRVSAADYPQAAGLNDAAGSPIYTLSRNRFPHTFRRTQRRSIR